MNRYSFIPYGKRMSFAPLMTSHYMFVFEYKSNSNNIQITMCHLFFSFRFILFLKNNFTITIDIEWALMPRRNRNKDIKILIKKQFKNIIRIHTI